MVHLSSPRASEICHVSQLPKKPLTLSKTRQESYFLELNTSFAKLSVFLLFSLIIEVYEYMVTTLWWTSIPSRECINPWSYNSDQYKIFLDNNTGLIKHIRHENEWNDHQRWNVLMFEQVLSSSAIRNVWRMVLIMGLQGLILLETQSAKAMPASMGCCEPFS